MNRMLRCPVRPSLREVLLVSLAAASLGLLSCGDEERALELYKQGKDAYAAKQLEDAREAFEGAVEADGVPGARLMLGKTLFYLGEMEAARDAFETALGENQGNATAHYWLGRIALADSEDLDLARDHFTKTIQLDEDSFNAHYYLARIHERQGNVKEALVEYNRALRIKNDFRRIHRGLADLYMRSGMTERAQREYSFAETPQEDRLGQESDAPEDESGDADAEEE